MRENQAVVVDIAVKATSGGIMDRRASVMVDVDTGIEGDYHTRGARMVTVLFKDSWEAACAELDVILPWTTRRANVYVDGILPLDCVGKQLQIGDVLLEVTGETRPCHIMEAAQPGLRAALGPEWRGGVTCRVLQSGAIQRGDAVTIIEKAD
ncbi:MAG: MOSC domain-containing protein [Candidatus Promineifilaceae bacterium]